MTHNTKIDKLSNLWAITRQELQKIKAAVQNVDHEAVKAYYDNPVKRKGNLYRVDGDVAILPIEGIIQPKSDIWSYLFGGIGLDVLTQEFNALLKDSTVKAIVLDIDSPGGSVFGVQEFSKLVHSGSKVKPVFAISSAMATSAAYWIGSAASKVYITDEAVTTGSIGVIATHVDISELEKKIGIKTTEVTAGTKKRIVSDYAPLTDEGLEELQGQVAHIYNAFTGDVAKFRGVSVEEVLANMADGQLFLGSQGIKAGLVDGIKSMKGTIAEVAEVARVKGIEKLSLPGHEALVKKLKADGVTSTGEAATQILAAEQKRVGFKIPNLKGGSMETKQEATEVTEVKDSYQAKWDSSPDLQKEFSSFGSYKAYSEAVAAGQVRITGRVDSAKAEPGQSVTPEALKAKWDASKELQEEFSSFESFKAYSEAVAAGRVRIFENKRRSEDQKE
ncbi:MAG: S49 family peptidase [Candidatus Scalindua sp.]|nr:S49 family peptidase [Candidatus Scalindua sp.]